MYKILILLSVLLFTTQFARGQKLLIDTVSIHEQLSNKEIRFSKEKKISKFFIKQFNKTQGLRVLNNSKNGWFYDCYIDDVYYFIAIIPITNKQKKKIRIKEGRVTSEGVTYFSTEIIDNTLFYVSSSGKESLPIISKLINILKSNKI